MATAIDTETGSDEYKEVKCSICAKESKDEIADYYCFDCNKHMCKSCLKTHNTFSENHNIVQGHGDGKDALTEKHADELITQMGRPVEKRGDRPVVRSEKKPSVEKSPGSKQVRKINVSIPEDEGMCVNTGCCHLSDGSLVIADNGNRRLKRVDPSSSKVTKYCDTDRRPTDVCCIGPQEVAVAFGSSQAYVYNAGSLTQTRTLELGHKTRNIACHGSLLYCAAERGKILYVHDVGSGRKLWEIRLKDTYGYDLFSTIIKGIALNGPGDRVYVADWVGGLVCVNKNGQLIFHISQKELGLSSAMGVTTDNRDHVFVCGWGSNNVVKVTRDGHVVGQILSEEDGIKGPYSPSYDVRRSQLYVGGESDQLLMVELK